MEILFLLTSISLSIIMFKFLSLLTGYKTIKDAFLKEPNDFMIMYFIFMLLMLSCVFFITLCAFNNTYWKFDYLFN